MSQTRRSAKPFLGSLLSAIQMSPGLQKGSISMPFSLISDSLGQICEMRSRCSESTVSQDSVDPYADLLAASRGLDSIQELGAFLAASVWPVLPNDRF